MKRIGFMLAASWLAVGAAGCLLIYGGSTHGDVAIDASARDAGSADVDAHLESAAEGGDASDADASDGAMQTDFTCMSKANCRGLPICCATATPVIGSQCQPGPCGGFVSGPLQLCTMSSECFNAGEMCVPVMVAGLNMMACRTSSSSD